MVFKTHLDIGYTDTIEEVLKKYRVTMMEGALKVVEASRDLPPEKRFSWTLAGWPLTHVLGPQQDPARRARIEQAVREGAITFHALPFTLHTETDDLEDLVRGLGFSTRLAAKYGRPLPISAKMTDVPCHSWVWPTLLAHAGVKFLQLGCNGTSAFVRVPPLFWWEGPDGSRILCHYTRRLRFRHHAAAELAQQELPGHGHDRATTTDRPRPPTWKTCGSRRPSACRASACTSARSTISPGPFSRRIPSSRSSAPTCRTRGSTAGCRCRSRRKPPTTCARSNPRLTRSTPSSALGG